jgi:peptidoglycan hydrolase CwlO-like protein
MKWTKRRTNMQKIMHKRTPIIHKAALCLLVAVLSFGFLASPYAAAQNFQSEINRLQAENAQNDAQVDALENQAEGYQDAIKKLAAKINALQGKINENTRQQQKLRAEIAEAEKELERQKGLLGQNIRSMYLEGDISTLEMLASSKDLSEFVDKEQYRTSVQDKIKSTLDKIQALRLQLKSQKEAVDLLLKEQLAQQSQLAASRQQQNDMLAYNQAQQDAFNAKTEKNRQRIDELIAAQRRANFSPDGGYYFLRFPGGARAFNAGSYPYRNGGFGMSPGPGCVDNDGPDPWGYCTRQCVSYAAWAVKASGRQPPMFYGNARDWVAAAYARAIPVYRSPQPGDVAISTSGYWGHAMYVEGVSGSTFTTTEYNANLDGRLSRRTREY